MKLEDLLRMAFNDGKRYGQGKTNLNFKRYFESTEYVEAIKLVKNCSIPDVVGRREQLCRCGKPEEKAYSPCCSLTCWCEQFE